MILIKVEPDASREDILTALAGYNQRAQLIARRGRIGTMSQHYKDLHDTIDYLAIKIEAFDKAPA